MSYAMPAKERLALEAGDDAPVRRIAAIDILALDGEAAAGLLAARLEAQRFTRLAFLNAHCVNLAHERPEYRRALGDFLVLPDGIGIDIASHLLFGRAFPENLNGTDFVPFLLGRLTTPRRVALVGAGAGVAALAACRLGEAFPQHVFLPVSHGFFSPGAETEGVLAALREAEADIVLVALGVPGQELFIARHLTGAEAQLAIGVGALFDFLAGRVARAPRPLRRLRLEWLFRLLIEPRRLWKRYVVGNPRFLAHVLRERRRAAGQNPKARG